MRTCRYCGATKTETIPKLTPPSTFTLRYDANGGTDAPASQTKTQGEALTLSSVVPAHSDTVEYLTVTLDPNGGTVNTSSLTAMRTTGYSFVNWNTRSDGSGTAYDPGESYTADADATLFAQWNASTSTEAVALPTPVWAGYTFKGWAADSGADSGVTGSYTPQGNVTLVALWEKIVITGDWGALTWTLDDDGLLTISGNGGIDDFEGPSSLAWRQYADRIHTLKIEQGVTYIGSFAFRGCAALTSVTIPDSVKKIGRSAFYDCAGLTELTIPYGVTDIGSWAFRGCAKLASIELPSSLASIGEQAFCLCTGLKSVTISSGTASIGAYAFNECGSLTSVTIPDSVTSIGEGAFFDCVSLTDVQIPNRMTAIADSLFYNCAALSQLRIPASVTSIESWAFRGCEALTELELPAGVTSIGDRAFCFCTGLKRIAIPYGVTAIEDLTFYGCSSLESAILPDSVTGIGISVFRGCTSLKSITIPYGVTAIEDETFCDCSSLESAIIPDSVTDIGRSAFYCCNNLCDVYYDGTEADWSAIKIGSYNDSLNSAVIHCAAYTVSFDANGGSGAPASQSGKSGTVLTLSSVVPKREAYVFLGWAYSGSALAAVFQPGDSLTVEADLTLFAVWARPDLILPAYLTEIDDEAFLDSAFTCVLVPESVTSIGSKAFANCPNLRRIIFTNGDIEVAEDFVSGCSEYLMIHAPRGSTVANNIALYFTHICPPAPPIDNRSDDYGLPG